MKIRAGIASGLVIAGVVGKNMPKFTLFGDTVTLASQVESTSASMKVQCTDLTQRLLRDSTTCRFVLEERRDRKMEKTTWWIRGTVDEGKGKSGFQPNVVPSSQRRYSQQSSNGGDTGMTSTKALTDSEAQNGTLSDVDEAGQKNPKDDENAESCLDLTDALLHEQIAPASQSEIANLSWTHVYKSKESDATPDMLAPQGILNDDDVEPGRRKSFINNIRQSITSRRKSNESNQLSDFHHSFGSMLSSVGSISTSLDGDKGFDITSVYSKDSAAFHNYWSR